MLMSNILIMLIMNNVDNDNVDCELLLFFYKIELIMLIMLALIHISH